MTTLFSQRSRCSTWRKLWLGLAEAEVELGITIITSEALDQMRAHLSITDADFEAARVEEKIRRYVNPQFYTYNFHFIFMELDVLTWVRPGCHGCKPASPCDKTLLD